MSITNQLCVKKIGVGIRLFFIIAGALAAGVFGQTTSAKNSDTTAKQTDFIEVVAKILSIDPIKGDVSVRLEFLPHGIYAKEDFTLARNVKLDTNSSTGKQDITFEKGKRMSPTETVLNMYDGFVTDYPFDSHKANLVFYFTAIPEKSADKPKPAEENPADQTKPETTRETEAGDAEEAVPFTLDFEPAMAGYKIESAKSKDSDDIFVDVEMSISRSPMVQLFSVFVMLLMWGISLAVFLFVLVVVISGRKVEIAMFSFIATLLFAFVAVRNSQPAVPPIGTLSDYLSFFWAEVILALGLLTIIFTWVIRPAAK